MLPSQTFKIARQTAAPTSVSPQTAPPVKTRPAADPDPIAAAMDQAVTDMPRLLTPQEVAGMLSLTDRTLERWRITGEGPRYSKLSRSTVRYLADDVIAFVDGRMRANTAQ